MNEKRFVPSNTDDTLSSTPSAVFDALHHPLRREVVRYFLNHECPVSLSELVEFGSTRETVSDENQRRLAIELHHNHLPKLTDYGFIVYDAQENTVERTLDSSALETSLNLVSRHS
ncbi:DUF7344 domain-containing protein [Haladaptatus sp. DFWS20]|uniref:DUF7344 domain-containing protein n=1 Tax=Haladaptatus sp. DFWS20 TaxID=3403467 RepID=UPI003EB7A132